MFLRNGRDIHRPCKGGDPSHRKSGLIPTAQIPTSATSTHPTARVLAAALDITLPPRVAEAVDTVPTTSTPPDPPAPAGHGYGSTLRLWNEAPTAGARTHPAPKCVSSPLFHLGPPPEHQSPHAATRSDRMHAEPRILPRGATGTGAPHPSYVASIDRGRWSTSRRAWWKRWMSFLRRRSTRPTKEGVAGGSFERVGAGWGFCGTEVR